MEPRLPLCALLLQKTEPGLHNYKRLLSSIDKYYTRLHVGMQDEAVRDQIVLNPARTISRLQKSFSILKDQKLSAKIAEEIFKGIVDTLVNSPDHILTREQAIQLVGSSLPVITRYPGAYLRLVADLILGYEGMFEYLVADEQHSSTLKPWLLSKKTYLDIQILTDIVERLIAMCDKCSGHGVADVSESWYKARTLISSLTSLIQSHHEEIQKACQKENLPPVENMRALNPDDKKSNQAPTMKIQKSSFKIPQSVLDGLESLNGPRISSAGHLGHALDFIQNEKIPEILHRSLESFPCRVCLERLTGTATTFSDLPGHLDRLKLARTGGFPRVEQKLRELASGAWKGKDLSHRIGSKKQKQEMLIPVLQARVTRTVSILWQVDVGFEHQTPSVQQQIVKIWQITNSDDEVDASINHIIGLQSYYSPETIRLCQQRPGQQPDGIFFPNKLGFVQQSYVQPKPVGAAKIDHALIEMSNKFYNVTEPFLKAIVDTTGREEFPFDLSPEEMEIVEHFDTSSLILGRSGTGKTTCLLFKILAKYRARQAMPDEKPIRQLLLTRSPFLAAKLQAYVRSLIDTQSEKGLDGAPSRNEKPESFFTLKDEDFPFVCTYDQFLDLLENTFRRANRQDFLGNSRPGARSTNAELLALDKPKLVDFNMFKTEYWSCLSGIAPSGCSPELLFAEIMGVIKGSAISASTLMPLSRAEYLSKTSKVSPAFASEVEREKVYHTFERYERQKKQRNQIDELDRVTSLLKLLKGNTSLETLIRQSFEEVYVDEIQDLRCLDIVLLLSCLCDTRGIHLVYFEGLCPFRFPEIKALFYDYYELISKELNQPSIAKPVQFMLAKNYRSHQGILSFASWVMAMLWNGFPETIDKLDPEIGQTGGPKPIIFAGFDSSILSAKMIGLVKLNDQVADFGAEQVILVRDEASKDNLQAQIGEIALVLTILESKGMEFDDVLVYDFFGGSGLGSSYRCLHLLAHGELAKFDSQKHAALCSELKHLYVAVTRARKQLWLMETVESSIGPILQALSTDGKVDLAEIVRKKDQDVAVKVKVLRAGGSVDPERWLKRAAHLLHQKNFADALFCFKKANDPRGIAHSQAWLYEQEGRSRRAVNDLEGSTASYEKAIVLFMQLELFSDASACYQAIERYDKAAEIWKNQGQLDKAAVFYEKGGHFREASDCLHSSGEYEQAIEVLRRGDEFDELIHYIKQHGHRLNSNTLDRYSRLCNILLKQGRISTELRETTINLLGSDVEKISFFKEFDMFDQMRSLYKDRRRWFEYYELSVAVGDLPGAMDTLLTQKLLPVVDKKIAECIFHYSMAETLMSSRGLTESRPELEKDLLQSSRSTHLEKTALQWLDVFSRIDAFEEKGAQTAFQSLVASPMLIDFFCLFAVAYQSEIKLLDRSKLMHLPMDIVNHAGRLIQTTEFGENQSSSEGQMLLCGLWSWSKNPTQMIVLPWSPLKTYGVQLPEDMLSPESLLSQARIWIQEKFSKTVVRFEEVAFNLFKELFPRRCGTFLVRGSCNQARSGHCHFFHERPNYDDCFLKLTCVMNVSEVLNRLSILYYQRVMPDSFSQPFLGMRRRWLQLLLDELIFATSYEHSPNAIVKMRTMLRTNTMFYATTSNLENLLFYRIKEEWHQIHSFSGILEQVQIAHFLGPWVALSYTRALAKKKSYILYRHRFGTHPLKNTFNAVLAVDQIRWAIAEGRTTDFYSRVRELLICMERAEASTLTNFHSVIAVLELVSTYILCLVNPNNAIVLPWSWAVQYLPAIYRAPVNENHFIPESDRLLQIGLLKATVTSLCKLADSLEHALAKHDFSFYVLGRKSPPSIQRRRIFDYLTTIVLNLACHPSTPRGFRGIWERAQRVITATWPLSSAPSTLSKLPEAVAREYTGYNGKDKLQVVCLDDNIKCPSWLHGFHGTPDGHVKLSTLLESSSSEDKLGPSTLGKDGSDADEYTRHELEVITSLQRRWRRVMKALADARCLRQSFEGQVFLQLFGLCQRAFNTLPGSEVVSTREKIRLRKLLFTDGVGILVDLDNVGTSLRRLKEYWRSCFENPRITAEEIEELDMVHGQVRSMETKLSNVAQMWSLKGLGTIIITLAAKSHDEKAREAQHTIWALQQEIEVNRCLVDAVAMHQAP